MQTYYIEVVKVANEKNLKRFNPSEAREYGKKGGRESGRVRKEKRLLKDCMLDLLDLDVLSRKEWNKLSKMGISPEDIDNRSLLIVSLFMKAVEKGDVNAFKEIRNLIGEDVSEEESSAIKKLDEVLGRIEGNI